MLYPRNRPFGMGMVKYQSRSGNPLESDGAQRGGMVYNPVSIDSRRSKGVAGYGWF